MNSKMFSVARTEFLKYIRKPTFWLAVVGVPVLLAIVSFFGNSDPDRGSSIPGLGDQEQISKDLQSGKVQLGFVDQSGLVPSVPSSFPAQTAALYRQYPDEASAKQALEVGDIPAFYVIPADYAQKGELIEYSESVNPFGSSIRESLMETLIATNLYDSKDPFYAYATLNPTANLKIENVSGVVDNAAVQNEQQRQASAFLLGTAFAMLLYISIFVSANWLLQSLIDEKENRVIEVVLSSIRPTQLLRGKIMGLGLLGLLQLTIWLGIGFALQSGQGGLGSILKSISVPTHVWLLAVLCFVLGFLIYGSLMAGIGAIANTMRESSQLTVIVVIPIIIPLLFLSILIDQPNGTLAQVLTYVPFTAPITLIVRSVVTTVPLWQLAFSVAIMVISVLGLQSLAARMFKATTLLSGSKPSLKSFVRALRG